MLTKNIFIIWLYKNNSLTTLNTSINYFHTSAILNSNNEDKNNLNNEVSENISSDSNKITKDTEITDDIGSKKWIEEYWKRYSKIFNTSKEKGEQRIIDLDKTKDPFENFISSDTSSSNDDYEEFPWLLDSEGKRIDFKGSIKLFDGVKLVSRYLETSYNMDKETISKLKLSELLKPFEEGKDISVLEFYNHIDYLYKNDPNISQMFKDAYVKASNITGKGLANKQSEATEDKNLLENATNTDSKPLGEFGEQSINQILSKFKEFKFREPISKMHITANPVPIITGVVSYGLLVNSFMKHVHNRPFKENLSQTELTLQHLQRRRLAYCFILIVAPGMVLGGHYLGSKYSNMFTIELFKGSNLDTKPEIDTANSKGLDGGSTIITSGLFGVIIKKIKQKVSEPLKLIVIL